MWAVTSHLRRRFSSSDWSRGTRGVREGLSDLRVSYVSPSPGHTAPTPTSLIGPWGSHCTHTHTHT